MAFRTLDDLQVKGKRLRLGQIEIDFEAREVTGGKEQERLTPKEFDLLSYLVAHPDIRIVIGGYCDDRGSAEYNLALGENRANAARTALISAGVPILDAINITKETCGNEVYSRALGKVQQRKGAAERYPGAARKQPKALYERRVPRWDSIAQFADALLVSEAMVLLPRSTSSAVGSCSFAAIARCTPLAMAPRRAVRRWT